MKIEIDHQTLLDLLKLSGMADGYLVNVNSTKKDKLIESINKSLSSVWDPVKSENYEIPTFYKSSKDFKGTPMLVNHTIFYPIEFVKFFKEQKDFNCIYQIDGQCNEAMRVNKKSKGLYEVSLQEAIEHFEMLNRNGMGTWSIETGYSFEQVEGLKNDLFRGKLFFENAIDKLKLSKRGINDKE